MGSRGSGRSWILATAILGLILTSCAPSAPDPAPGPAATAGNPSPPSGPSPQPTDAPGGGPEVPRELGFSAPALGGGEIDGADYAGSDLVIWFWAPW